MPQGFINGQIIIPEISDPTAEANQGKIWTTAANKVFFQDGAGTKHLLGPTPAFKSFHFQSAGVGAGTYYMAGYYEANAADANLTQASTTVTMGTANVPYAAHAFIVSGGNGTTDGSDLVLTVTGTSITDAGTRTAADSQVIEATAEVSATDSYHETPKKWIGQITYTLSSTGGATFSYDFNYGLCKYEDYGNRDFTVTDIEAVGLADANDTNFELEFIKHEATGWTYAASGFVPGSTPLYVMSTDHGTENDLVSGIPFAWKRAALSDDVTGANGEGVLTRVTTGSASSIGHLSFHIGVDITS